MSQNAAMPPKLIRRRVEVHVGDFFAWLGKYYAERGWNFGPHALQPGPAMPRKPPGYGDAWASRDVSVAVSDAAMDGRILELTVALKNIPSVVDRQGNEPVVAYDHRFAIALPPEYPGSLQMRIVNLTPTLHPRMLPPERSAPACIYPNAELDQVLREVLFNVLFKPDVVRPPALFSREDHGFRAQEMKWYSEYGPERLFKRLCELWDIRQKELAAAMKPVEKKIGPFRIKS